MSGRSPLSRCRTFHFVYAFGIRRSAHPHATVRDDGGVLFALEARRFVVAQGASYDLDEDGLHIAAPWWGSSQGRVALSDIDDAESFVLLGEPGIGKSTSIRRLVGEGPTVTYIHLDEVGDVGRLHELMVPGLSRAGTEQHTIVLDGFDECPLPGKALTRHVTTLVSGFENLRVIVGSRSADWYEPFGESLGDVLGGCATYELLPLTIDDIEAFAHERACDGEAFIGAVREAAAGPLAGLPLTLDLLLRSYVRDGGLPHQPHELYEQGLRALAEEPDRGRGRGYLPSATGEERLAVAARIAAVMVLGGYGSVCLRGEPGTQSVSVGELVGGVERLPSGPVTVTSELVEASLSTALFAGRGAGKLGPQHASLSAYLCARYLNAHELTEHQMRSLVTRTSALGRTSIPTRLREMAAWLAAIDPTRHGWIVTADPEAVSAHATLVTDGGLRATLVDYLLDHPDVDRSGARRRWRLRHDGLPTQLRGPLTQPLLQETGPHLGHPIARRAHTALQIARASRLVEVVPDVQALIEAAGMNPVLRASAAHVLQDIDPRTAQQTLKQVLPELVKFPDHDPDDELLGVTLDTCWPDELTAQELVAALKPPSRDNLVGSYAMFLNRLTERPTDRQVLDLVRELHALSSVPPDRHGQTDHVEGVMGLDTGSRRSRRLATALLARLLNSEELSGALPEAGWLLAHCIRLREHLQLPSRFLSAVDSNHDETRDVRRSLVIESIRHIPERAVPLLMWRWQVAAGSRRVGLLGHRDLQWLFELDQSELPPGATAALIRAVFDPDDPEHIEIAWEHRNHALFEATAARWFEAVELDSERAEELREDHRLATESADWPEAATHVKELHDVWQRCMAGEHALIPHLYRLLWTDPETGACDFPAGDPSTWPGSGIVDLDLERLLWESAAFLRSHDPSMESWTLTVGTISYAALAGYVALREIHRHSACGGDVPLPTLADLRNWAVAVVRCPYASLPENSGPHAALEEQVASRAPAEVVAAYTQWFKLAAQAGAPAPSLARIVGMALGESGSELFEFWPALVAIVDESARLCADGGTEDSEAAGRLASGAEALRSLGWLLASTGHLPADRWQTADTPGSEAQTRAIMAVVELRAGVASWTEVLDSAGAEPSFGQALAAEASLVRRSSDWMSRLTDAEVEELASWLLSGWGAEPVNIERPAPDDRIRDWRDGVLNELGSRSSTAALTALSRFRTLYTESYRLRELFDQAEARQRDETWRGPTPHELARLIRDKRLGFVTDEDSLYRLVIDVLERLGERLQHVGQLLWNESRPQRQLASEASATSVWSPKFEAALSAFLEDHLRNELASTLVVNREVLIQQTTSRGHGLAVDLLVSGAADTSSESRIAVPIEVKGNWNPRLVDDLQAQLVEDYLPALGAHRGIYLCAWFAPDEWTDRDPRRAVAASRDRDRVQADLLERAASASDGGVEVAAVVLDVPRPTPTKRKP